MLRLSFVHGLSFAPVRADCYFRLFSCVCVGVRVHNSQTGEIPVDEFVRRTVALSSPARNSETHIGETFSSNNFSYTLCVYTMS